MAGTHPIITLDSGLVDHSVVVGLVEGAILPRDQEILGQAANLKVFMGAVHHSLSVSVPADFIRFFLSFGLPI